MQTITMIVLVKIPFCCILDASNTQIFMFWACVTLDIRMYTSGRNAYATRQLSYQNDIMICPLLSATIMYIWRIASQN